MTTNDKLETAVRVYGNLLNPEAFCERFKYLGANKARLYEIQNELELENWTTYKRRMKEYGSKAIKDYHENNLDIANRRLTYL